MPCNTFYGTDCDGTLFVNISLNVSSKEQLLGLLGDLILSEHYVHDVKLEKLFFQLKESMKTERKS